MRILIFGCGNQARKYLSFLKEKYIDVVTNNNICNFKVSGKKYYFNIFKRLNIDINSYDLIILAVHPIKNQTDIINYLLTKKVNVKVIIEKPVTYDLALLKRLISYNNITYNLEEILFNKYFLNNNIDSIDIYCDNRDCTLEHSLGNFIFRKNFSFLLKKLKYNKTLRTKDLEYKLVINGGLKVLENKNGYMFLDEKKIGNISLYSSLPYLLKNIIGINVNILYKYNYYLLKRWLFSNGVYKSDTIYIK